MKVQRIRHGDPNKTGVFICHAENYDGNDVTLCGLALEGEKGEWSEAETVEGRIDCQSCQNIIRYCKSFRIKWDFVRHVG